MTNKIFVCRWYLGRGVRDNASKMNWIIPPPLLKLNKKIESTNVEINFFSVAFFSFQVGGTEIFC